MTISDSIATQRTLPAISSATLNSSAASISSFAAQLASAIEQMLGKSKTGSQIEIDINAAPAQSSGSQQITMVLKNSSRPDSPLDGLIPPGLPQPATPLQSDVLLPPGPAERGGPLQSVTQPDSLSETIVPFFQSVVTGSTRTPAAFADTVDGAAALAPKKPLTATDAYWASQPPEVRVLQHEPDQGVRYTEAMKLAQQGFTIDVPIMVWGWNPLVTMQLRQADGYTWVPSGLQPPIPVTPGIQMAGYASYDPNHPPAGSIKVTTDFATGTLDDPARSKSAGAVTDYTPAGTAAG